MNTHQFRINFFFARFARKKVSVRFDENARTEININYQLFWYAQNGFVP